jgi:starch phosphorylase
MNDRREGDARSNDGRRDIEQAIAETAERLPEELEPLARLAFNYRWSWMARGASLFQDLSPEEWRRSGCNPRFVLEAVAPRRFHEVSRDESYVARVHAMAALVEEELKPVPPPAGMSADRPVAYFCSEFGAHCSLALYGGGLGILAGDVLKAASDLGVPLVGVGLLYRQGYFHQRLDRDGWQNEYWTRTDFERTPAVRVTGPGERPLTVGVRMRGRHVHCHIWRVDFGRVPLYLLDTDLEENDPIDRWITARLYVGDRHVRLAQYAVLGIGGVRALRALGIRPSLIHLNEGHAGLASLERLRMELDAGHSYEEALALVRSETVFTTHTPVAAGNEAYGVEEVERVMRDFNAGVRLPQATLYDLGRVRAGDAHDPLSTTTLALRTARASIGVSRRHGEVARAMWQPLWPEKPVERVPIGHVTNGVHVATWMAAAMQDLLEKHLGAGWSRRPLAELDWSAVGAIPDADLWAVRCELREALVRFVRERSVRDRLGRLEEPDYVEAAARVFDPRVLTVGFARRVATYKRLYLLASLAERAASLLNNPATPVQLVIAGKAHPSDQEAKQTLSRFFQLKRAPDVIGRVVFLEDYDMHLAPRIVSGVDLWLNIPRPPLEASGTSGMKVVLNGGLNLSVLDGWWEEAYDGENGWAIHTPEGGPSMQDEHDAHALAALLEGEVIPLFYERDAAGIPRRWLARVKASMRTLIPRFSAQRMVTDYVTVLYAPGAK